MRYILKKLKKNNKELTKLINDYSKLVQELKINIPIKIFDQIILTNDINKLKKKKSSTHEISFTRVSGCFYRLVYSEKYFSFTVKTTFESKHRFDQCGIVMYLDSDNWIKGSIEYENETLSLPMGSS